MKNIGLFVGMLLTGGYNYGQNAVGVGIHSLSNQQIGKSFSFTPNKGQIADMNGKLCPDILYKGQSGGADIYLRKTGISYVYSNMGEVMHEVDKQMEVLVSVQPGNTPDLDKNKMKDELMRKMNVKIHRVDMDFEGANNNLTTINDEEIEGYNNYYYTHCPNGILNVKQYYKVTYRNIYNGIDIAYCSGTEKGLKYDLIVQPHADPRQIKLHWKGAETISLNREGNLVIKTSVNEFTESIPKVYQNINGKIVDIKTEYVLTPISEGEFIINFSFSTFNSSFSLVIDPWATYYGGNKIEYTNDITTDNSGNVLITGYNVGNFPVGLVGGNVVQQSVFGGSNDAFVVKLDPNGVMQWATYYGGKGNDFGCGIATDNVGNIIISGTAQAFFPVGSTFPNVVEQPLLGGLIANDQDAFVVKFNSNGARQWATYYGGSRSEWGEDIATDKSGNVIITGTTQSTDFPAKFIIPNVVQQPLLGLVWKYDAFVVKFSPTGASQWATYYGGDENDYGFRIATDNSDNIVITGITLGGSFPIGTIGGGNFIQQSIHGGVGGTDAFVVKFNAFGIRQWATFYGGSGSDNSSSYRAVGIATDNLSNIIVTGYTSGSFPIGAAPGNVIYQPGFGGMTDAFVVKFSPFGVLQWATYCGSFNYDWAFGVATDLNNNVYVLMETEDIATPDIIDDCTWQPVFNGGSTTSYYLAGKVEDQIIIKFSPIGKKICATYMGGIGEDDLDYGGGVTVYGNSLYITASTEGGYPVTNGVAQTNFGGPNTNYYNGSSDVFVASLCTNICEGKTLGLNYTASTTSACTNAPVTFVPTVANSCDTTGYKYHWVFTGGNPTTSDSMKPTVSFSGIGTHDVKLFVTTLCKKDSLIKTNYMTVDPCVTCNLNAQFTKGTASCTNCGCKQWIMINAIGGTSPYTYLWPDGYDKRYKNQLCPGAYTINIKDKNGCSVNVNLTAP